MRLERLTTNKIKIFLSSDDLFERGLSKEDIWKDSMKWHQLFHDMLEEASEEFDVEFEGSVAVEIFSLHAQGMIMIITIDDVSEENEILYDGFIEMQVVMESSENLLYTFDSFEEIISLAKRLSSMGIGGGTIYFLNQNYFFLMKTAEQSEVSRIASIIAEYGDPSIVTVHRLEEYGKLIIEGHAVETILQFFS